MKTTIKLGSGQALVMQPAPSGLRLDLTFSGVALGGHFIEPHLWELIKAEGDRAMKASEQHRQGVTR